MNKRFFSRLDTEFWLSCFLLIIIGTPVNAQFYKKITSPGKPTQNSGSFALPGKEFDPLEELTANYKSFNSKEFGGRLSGTIGSESAGRFLGKQWDQLGIYPYGRNFFHPFKIVVGKSFTPATKVRVNRQYIFLPEDIYPLGSIGTNPFQGYFMKDAREFGQPWLIPMFTNRNESVNTSIDWESRFMDTVLFAKKLGATAVFFYKNFPSDLGPKFSFDFFQKDWPLPVFIINHEAYKKHIASNPTILPFSVDLHFQNETKTTANIIGRIDNSAPYDVMVMAHFDYFSYDAKQQGVGNSNPFLGDASLLLTFSKLLLTKEADKKYNFILVGLADAPSDSFSINALLSNKQVDFSKVAFAINLDAVGQLDWYQRKIFVEGAGMSRNWMPFFKTQVVGLNYDFLSSESPSFTAHSFSQKRIPYLSFSTLNRETEAKEHPKLKNPANLKGALTLLNQVYRLIVVMDGRKPLFADSKQQRINDRELLPPKAESYPTKQTKSAGQSSTSSSTISKPGANPTINHEVGIIWDRQYDGFGVLIKGIEKGKPASRSELKTGDIILEVKKIKINKLPDYIKVMNELKRGEEVIIKVKRGVTVQELFLPYF